MKVVKTAAIIVGAAALAATGAGLAMGFGLGAGVGALGALTGVSSTVFGVAAAGTAALAVESVLPHPSTGGSQTKWKADPYAGIPGLLGRSLVSGNIVAKRGSGGNNTYEHFVTVLSLGPIKGIQTTFANRTTVTFDEDTNNGNAVGTYRNLIWQSWQSGLCPEPAAMMPRRGAFPGWTSAHKLSGLAAVLNTMEYDSKGDNQLTTEPQMAWIAEGRFVWDPRQDDTYPGGSGTCRRDDISTHVYSEDPHLHGLQFALGYFQNGKRVGGLGSPVTFVDVASFVEGANLNDARGWKVGGQIVSRPDTPWNNLKSILQAGGAKPTIVGGLLSAINRAPRVSLATITRADIVGDCSFAGTQPRRTRINGVIPVYRSEAHDWEMVSASAVLVDDYVALDGGERVKEMQFNLVQQVDQAAQLAAYEICDAREAGPGTIPLGPWWLNYRLGDCVTFQPEDGWSVKVQITGRDVDAQTGKVTYTVKSETDDKHAFALGQTGTAPPTASIVYDTSVAAPDVSEWAITGTALEANGSSIPALVLTGSVANSSAASVSFEYRIFTGSAEDDANWTDAGSAAPTVTQREITGVTPDTAYEVAISYTVRGVRGDRLILGPVTAGSLVTPAALQQAVLTSWIVEVSAGIAVVAAAADGTITIANNTRRYADGHADVAVTGATIASSYPAGTVLSVAYDDPSRLGGAVTYALYEDDNDAHASVDHPGRHYVGYVTIPESGTSTGGGGGVSGGREGACVVDDTLVLMANAERTGPGETKLARDVVAGDWIWTQHEVTRVWGAWQVTDLSFFDAEVFASSENLPRATAEHQFDRLGWWRKAKTLGTADGTARVAKFSVEGPRTYVTVQPDGTLVLNHNLKTTEPDAA